MDQFNPGDKVMAFRRDGKDGVPYEAAGEFVRHMNVVVIQGEKTGLVRYEKDGVEYPVQLSKITKI